MSSSNNEEAVSGPTRALQDTYLQSLRARQSFLDVVTGGAASEREHEAAHADLHASTMKWFDALEPYLEEYDDLEHFWDDVKLWRAGYKTEEGVYCQACENGWEIKPEQQPGFYCPGCGEGVLQKREFVATDDDGNPKYEWVRGLKALSRYRGRTKTVTETREMTCRVRTVERTVPVRLKPDRLLKACHELDKAGDRLDLLADVAKNVPQTEITEDTIDDFQERIHTIVKAAQEGDEQVTGVESE